METTYANKLAKISQETEGALQQVELPSFFFLDIEELTNQRLQHRFKKT